MARVEIDDPLIDDLMLASVIPAPNASRVLVTLVASREDLSANERDVVLTRIEENAAELREDVAAEITRQRVPELVFRIASRSELVGLY
ncbi:MAG: hypothetical protein QM831_00260 [Kofleriaceae bacterium]